MIERLVRTTGNVRDLLGLPADGPIDLTSKEWGELEIVGNVIFDNITISNSRRRFLTKFVECIFCNCRFNGIISYTHLSGSGNTWQNCIFEKCQLQRLGAPRSRFTGCVFEGLQLDAFNACETVFDNCIFRGTIVRGLKARRIGRGAEVHPETIAAKAAAMFKNCQFIDSKFVSCQFEYVCFENCSVSNTNFDHCSFSGVIGSDPWLAEVQSGDPYVPFLRELSIELQKKLPADSKSIKLFEEYLNAFLSHKTSEKNFVPLILNGDVPEKEQEKFFNVMDKVSDCFQQ